MLDFGHGITTDRAHAPEQAFLRQASYLFAHYEAPAFHPGFASINGDD